MFLHVQNQIHPLLAEFIYKILLYALEQDTVLFKTTYNIHGYMYFIDIYIYIKFIEFIVCVFELAFI